jgi:SAM-dependent methyltransferase
MLQPNCPVCESKTNNFGSAGYPLASIDLKILVFYCKICNTFFRDIDDELISQYSNKPIWTKPENEELVFISRIRFFEYIYNLVKEIRIIYNWVDFGSSYGHFISYLKNKNLVSYGVDLSNDAIIIAKFRGLIVKKYISDLPIKNNIDVISILDSLYYLKKPKITLKEIHQRLGDNGLIILRISNRNWRFKFDKYLLRKKHITAMIDHTIGYSKKSIIFLLKESGFKILKITSIEKGKTRPRKFLYLWYFYYYFSLFLNFVTNGYLNLSPGIIIIAKKTSYFVK